MTGRIISITKGDFVSRSYEYRVIFSKPKVDSSSKERLLCRNDTHVHSRPEKYNGILLNPSPLVVFL